MVRLTRSRMALIIVGTLVMMISEVYAAAPMLISYQGRLMNAGGNPISGTFSMTFSIYSVPTGGTPVWSETHGAVTVQTGAFTVNLGSVTPLINWYFYDSTRYLGVTVGTDPEQTPRARLASVPYALKVGTVDGATAGTIYGNQTINGILYVYNPNGYNGIYSTCATTGHYYNFGVEGLGRYGELGNFGVKGVAGDAWGSDAYPNSGIYGIGLVDYGRIIWAGYFDGWANVTQNFYAAAKFFRIDDPQKPADRTLVHACVESDQYKNIYDGTVALDSDGKATITLPEWFDDLNASYRYQLTCVGGYAPVYIASKVDRNQFAIAGGTPGLEVSWQVTGVRKDAYALAHPVEVIQEKPAGQKGRYLHPVELGKSEEEGFDYAARKISAETAPHDQNAGVR